MFVYEKKLQYPVKIANPNPKLAAAIISQYGGPDGELGASLRYLSQRYSMPYPELKGLLTDIGTEELGHLEMVGTIVHQLTRNLTVDQIKEAGFDTYFVDHTTGVFPQFASGYPWSAATMQVTGDTIADHQDGADLFLHDVVFIIFDLGLDDLGYFLRSQFHGTTSFLLMFTERRRAAGRSVPPGGRAGSHPTHGRRSPPGCRR